MIKRPRPSPALVVAIIALVVAIGGVAAASVPESNGTINGCYDKAATPHPLYVIDPEASESCGSGQTPISWNQTGPVGPQGPQGAAGPPGQPGQQGARGPAGAPATNPSGYSLAYFAKVDWIDKNGTLTTGTYQLSPGITSAGPPPGGDASHWVFRFNRSIDDCVAEVTHEHKLGRGGPLADRADSPDATANAFSVLPVDYSTYETSDGFGLEVGVRSAGVERNRAFRGEPLTSIHYAALGPFNLLVFCPAPPVPVYAAPIQQGPPAAVGSNSIPQSVLIFHPHVRPPRLGHAHRHH